MKVKIIKAYFCDHCNRLYQRKHAVIYHEEMCNRNPLNFRACHSCMHCIKKETKIWSGIDDYYTCEPVNKDVEFLYCGLKEIFLYTPQNEIKGNYSHTDVDGGTFENFSMPKECDKKI